MNEHVRPSKFRRYRERKRAAGLRELRMWVPDVGSPAFVAQAEREAMRINGAADSGSWTKFVEAQMASWDDWVGQDAER